MAPLVPRAPRGASSVVAVAPPSISAPPAATRPREIAGPPLPPPAPIPAAPPVEPNRTAPAETPPASDCASRGEDLAGGVLGPRTTDRDGCAATLGAAVAEEPPQKPAAQSPPAPASPPGQSGDDPVLSFAGQIGSGIASLFGGSDDTQPRPSTPTQEAPAGNGASSTEQAYIAVAPSQRIPAAPLPAEPDHHACPKPARTYIAIEPATGKRDIGENGYAIENRCDAYAIAVQYQVASDDDCDKMLANDVTIPARRWVGDYSFCDKRPEVVEAHFKN